MDKLKSQLKTKRFLFKPNTSETEVRVWDVVYKHVCIHKESKSMHNIDPYHPVSAQHIFQK